MVKRNNWITILQAFLISFACTVQFHRPLSISDYEEKIDYLLAEAAELLGTYNYVSVLIFILAFVFLKYINTRMINKAQKIEDTLSDNETQHVKKEYSSWLLPAFFSFCLFMGRSYQETNSWDYCFGSIVNFMKFALAFTGMTILLKYAIGFLLWAYEKLSESEWQSKWSKWIFDSKCFLKVFLILMLVWMPIIMLSYPGNVCYDVIGQIEQGVGITSYSAHHPLLHTLLVGGLVELGFRLTGSYDYGLFVYVILQALMLASALAGTVWWLNKREFSKGKVSHAILLIILGIYVFSPMYSNMASTAIKDIPFAAAVIWYVILLAEVFYDRDKLKKPGFVVTLILVEVLMSLLRNNGFYVLVLTGIILAVAWWKNADKSQRLRNLLYLLIVPMILSKLIGGALQIGLDAKEGKAAEMFSLPFQQTARYLQLYRDEIDADEKLAIENVLGDVEAVAMSYNPDLADPVKKFYYDHDEITGGELVQYFMAWAKGLFKHPGVYFEAFFAHVYGWFDPEVSNAPRYEAEYDLFTKRGLFAGADKVLVFVYRLADRITPLGLLQNVGAYTWAMFILCGYMMRNNKSMLALMAPLLISLLICMVSPCFYMHPRYAYPYMFTIPFLYGLAERSRE